MKESDFAAPKEIVDVVMNGSGLQPLKVNPEEIYAHEKPISSPWREKNF